jgi:DedD protein
MNQELTQRIIGAIVVTALAAIFIPMLFDDPVDNSGQAVSELVIPEEPALKVDDSLSKLPRDAVDVSGLPDETSETPDMNRSDIADTEPPLNDQALSADPMDTEVPGEEEPEEPAAGQGQSAADTPSLDTGDVEEVKKPAYQPALVEPASKHEPPKTPKKTEHHPAPKLTPVKPAATVDKPASKPVKATADLSRWYIQAGIFGKKENALALAQTIRKQGMPVLLETIQTAKGTLYQLRVGPELDKKRAASMKAKLGQQNIKGILVAE